MKKRKSIAIVLMILLALALAATLVACNEDGQDNKQQTQPSDDPVTPEPETEYVVDVLNFLPERPDIWSYGGELEQGKTTVRVHFTVPFTGEYRFNFEAGGNSDYEGAALTRATLNDQPFDFSDGYENVPMKMGSGDDNVLEMELYSADEHGYYGFNFSVREGFQDMVLLPGEEGTFTIDPADVGNGVKRYYTNSEDGIEFYAAYRMDLQGQRVNISVTAGRSDKSRMDVPIAGVNKIYISVINVSDQAAQVHISEGEFDSLDAFGDTIEVTYTGNEASSYLIKVRFTESNMRIRIKKKGEADLYTGSVLYSTKMFSAETGEYVGTCYGLHPGEYQLIGVVGQEYYANFTIEEAGTFVFELSEIN